MIITLWLNRQTNCGYTATFLQLFLPVSGNMREVQGEQNGNKVIEIIHVDINLQHE